MDYKRVLRLHFVNHLSGREIAESCGDCSKTTVNEFLKRFRENPELSYPLPADVTNEYIESILYKKPGVSANQLLYRDFNKEAVYKALARKGETLKHLWQKYNANVNHFFTLLGKMFFTSYGKEFFSYSGKQIFTS